MLLFDNIITDINSLCGPCGDPASPEAPLYWEKSADGGVTWVQTPRPSLGDPSIVAGDMWRYVCPDGPSNPVTIIDCDETDTYADTTVEIDQGQNPPIEICFPCCSEDQVWEFRIDDAEADIDHVDAPNLVTGDRPNSDPGNPTPDQAWQRATLPAGSSCVFLHVEEIWPDGVDPDGPVQLGEFFVFYLRTSCDGGVSWQPEIRITLQT